jgi:biotin transport system substrate-specific component
MTSLSVFLEKNKLTTTTAKVVLGVLLLALCSQVVIPLKPVPITFQTIGVLLIGLTYERRNALLTVATYILVGTMGLPVFSDFGFGIARLMGPSGGYIMGFLVAVFAMTTLRQFISDRNFKIDLGLSVLGTAIIMMMGVTWLTTFMDFSKAISVGITPFIIPGILKALLLSKAVGYIKR